MENAAAGGLTSADDRRPELRSPPRPLRVLAAGRRRPDRGAEVPSRRSDHLHGGRAPRHAGGRGHRSRRHVRRAPLLRGRARRRRQADHRRRGLRRAGLAVRPEPRRERGEVPPPHAPGGERDGLPEPAEARVGRLPGGLLPPAAHGQGAAGRARRGRASACRDVCRASCRRCCSPGRIAARRRRRDATATSSVPIATSSSCRITASRTSGACSRSRSRSHGRSTSRSSRRTTSTTRCGGREAARRAALHPAAEAPERSEAAEVRLGGVLPEERRRRCERVFHELPDACDNTLRIAERVELDLVYGDRAPADQRFHLPRFETPDRKGARGVPARARVPGRARSVRPRSRPTSAGGSTTSWTSSRRWGSPATS